MAKVIHIYRAPKKRAKMEELEAARVVEDAGLEGCAHARPQSKRQLLLVDVETLQEMQLEPGIIRENFTTQGLDVNALAIGKKLSIGEVQLEVSAVCDPCEQIEALRPGLMAAMVGKRGMLCRVKRGGVVRRGDEILVGGKD